MNKNWKTLDKLEQINEIKKESETRTVLIFKHSTRCSISGMAWDRLQRNWKAEDSEKLSPYYLDLIRYREISNLIAKEFGVEHESPQAILIKNGVATYDTSHMGINYQEIISQA
ncbi:MAG TPA: bacillithiol system redox-active protein YtxJ [Cyclobacteriaceae bacterium]|nr:bacillithiol system redox-active protein YtxJ [Cyclobacteriaceae bacterium]